MSKRYFFNSSVFPEATLYIISSLIMTGLSAGERAKATNRSNRFASDIECLKTGEHAIRVDRALLAV